MRKRVFAESVVLTLALALSVTIGTAVAAPAATVFVSNSHDSGPGSFRDAIDKANANHAITRVQFLGRVSTIDLQQTVWFTGPQNLTIAGNGFSSRRRVSVHCS